MLPGLFELTSQKLSRFARLSFESFRPASRPGLRLEDSGHLLVSRPSPSACLWPRAAYLLLGPSYCLSFWFSFAFTVHLGCRTRVGRKAHNMLPPANREENKCGI